MRRMYNAPQTREIVVTAQEMLLSSGRGFNSNLGLGWSPVPGDPNLAW